MLCKVLLAAILVSEFTRISCLLQHMDRSDVMAVKARLEDEKARRLLLQNDVEMLMLKTARLERQIGRDSESGVKGFGSVFVRWGRTSCPGNGTEFVYKGFAAGSHFQETGSGANYLCLPEEPLWGQYQTGRQVDAARIYGGEYQFDHHLRENFFGKEINQKDAPCVVCRTPRATVMMVPGRNACYDDWNMEYRGYLVATSHGTKAASEYVCLDGQPEVLSEATDNTNGKLFYMVEAQCGALPCPPYIQGRELTCVVCSK